MSLSQIGGPQAFAQNAQPTANQQRAPYTDPFAQQQQQQQPPAQQQLANPVEGNPSVITPNGQPAPASGVDALAEDKFKDLYIDDPKDKTDYTSDIFAVEGASLPKDEQWDAVANNHGMAFDDSQKELATQVLADGDANALEQLLASVINKNLATSLKLNSTIGKNQTETTLKNMQSTMVGHTSQKNTITSVVEGLNAKFPDLSDPARSNMVQSHVSELVRRMNKKYPNASQADILDYASTWAQTTFNLAATEVGTSETDGATGDANGTNWLEFTGQN